MTPEAALVELLSRVGTLGGAAVTVNTEELNEWPAAAVAALKSQHLLRKALRDSSAKIPHPTPPNLQLAQSERTEYVIRVDLDQGFKLRLIAHLHTDPSVDGLRPVKLPWHNLTLTISRCYVLR